MAHTNIDSKNQIIKSYDLCIKKWNKGTSGLAGQICDAFIKYYNRCNDWTLPRLTTMKIGDFKKYIPESTLCLEDDKKPNFIKMILSDKWKDEPIYKMFIKGFNGADCDNIMAMALLKEIEVAEEDYFGFSDTTLKRAGFIQHYISNLKTTIGSLKPKIKRKSLKEDSTEAEWIEQVVYEMTLHNFSTPGEFNEYLKYIQPKKNITESQKERIQSLKKFFESHKQLVEDTFNIKKIEALKESHGCKRNPNHKSFSLVSKKRKKTNKEDGSEIMVNENIKITRLDDKTFNIKIGKIISDNILFDIDVFSRKDITKNGVELIDLINNFNTNYTFVKKIKYYKGNPQAQWKIVLSCTLPFERKEHTEIGKVVGNDINIKHMMICTNIKDDGLIKGYTNIYKESLKDEKFVNLLNNQEKMFFHEMSGIVTFCPLETEFLIAEFSKADSKLAAKEKRFRVVIKNLIKQAIANGDDLNRQYLQNILSLRKKIIKALQMYNEYSLAQSIYDADKSKEFIEENPFSSTPKGEEMLEIRNALLNSIKGCRNSICTYAYRIYLMNGYNIAAFENLESSSFKKNHSHKIPTPNTVLKAIENDEISESLQTFIENGFYNISYNSDNTVEKVEMTEKGNSQKIKNGCYSNLMKMIGFASIKDYFITLNNKGDVGVAIVPSCFTSQIDSLTNTLLCYEEAPKTKKGKTKIIPLEKELVRTSQEKHINGLNADYNAARNIANYISIQSFRENLTELPKINQFNGPYNRAVFETRLSSPVTIQKILMNLGAYRIVKEDFAQAI